MSNDRPGRALEVAEIVPQHGVTVGKGGGRDQEIVRADRLASGQLRRDPGMDPGDSQIERENWRGPQNRFDEGFALQAARR